VPYLRGLRRVGEDSRLPGHGGMPAIAGLLRRTACGDVQPADDGSTRQMCRTRRNYSGHVLGISGGDPEFRDDHGAADPAVTAALGAFAAGQGSETEVLMLLSGGRLLVPVVAVLAEQIDTEDQPGPDRSPGTAPGAGTGPGARGGARVGGGEKSSEMAMPTLIGLDGRRAIPAFTCLDTMRRWQPDARPVPVSARHVWQVAEADACAVVIDVGGPVPFAVEGARLSALARGEAPPPPFADPDVHEIISDVLAGQLDVAAFELRPPESGADRDLEIVLTLAQGSARRDVTELATQIGNAVMARLGGRLRRGVAIWPVGRSDPGGAGPRQPTTRT
jgi:hypothetical protein